MNPPSSCAQVLVQQLENLGVTHVFGLPGAKIDSVFEAVEQSAKLQLVLCRHEQNAAFMAAAMGRMTGRIGVVLVTSGPGVANLATGLATATAEGDPVLAIGGQVPLPERVKSTHQSLDGVALLRPVTKYAAEISTPGQLGELLGEAVRAAESGRPGATFLSLPRDIGLAPYPGKWNQKFGRQVSAGPGAASEVELAAQLINGSRRPALLLGMQASDPRLTAAVKDFVCATGIPYVSTFQGPGAWVGKECPHLFAGRVGLFHNQPGDQLLEESDCVITVGYEHLEYDPSIWNARRTEPVIAIDAVASRQDGDFLPAAELVGDIGASLELLRGRLSPQVDPGHLQLAGRARKEIDDLVAGGARRDGFPIHPLRIVHELTKVVTPETTVALDVGSHYIWMNRYFSAAFPRQVLVSNGQQTLGVAMPWAMAANLARPGHPVFSVSGDGGFMFSSAELETAVRLGLRFVHLVWDSGSYDMVAFQEQAAYGRTAGVKLGHVDIPQFAAAFGAKGVNITSAGDIAPALAEGLASPVPFFLSLPVDYSENIKLMEQVRDGCLN